MFNTRFARLVYRRYVSISQSDAVPYCSHRTGTTQPLQLTPASRPRSLYARCPALGIPGCRKGGVG